MYCGSTTGFLRPLHVVHAQGGRGKVPVDLEYSERISGDKNCGAFPPAIGQGKVYVNDPIERMMGSTGRKGPLKCCPFRVNETFLLVAASCGIGLWQLLLIWQ